MDGDGLYECVVCVNERFSTKTERWDTPTGFVQSYWCYCHSYWYLYCVPCNVNGLK